MIFLPPKLRNNIKGLLSKNKKELSNYKFKEKTNWSKARTRKKITKEMDLLKSQRTSIKLQKPCLSISNQKVKDKPKETLSWKVTKQSTINTTFSKLIKLKRPTLTRIVTMKRKKKTKLQRCSKSTRRTNRLMKKLILT